MAWALLTVAGLLEVVWASLLKRAFGEDVFITVVTGTALVASFLLLRSAMHTIPVGTAYAVWTGIGAAGAAVVGVIAFGEPASLQRFACIGLVVAGIVGLRLAS